MIRRTSCSQESEQTVQCFKEKEKDNDLLAAQNLGASITVIFNARLWATCLIFKTPIFPSTILFKNKKLRKGTQTAAHCITGGAGGA